jgi:hypothetical protein
MLSRRITDLGGILLLIFCMLAMSEVVLRVLDIPDKQQNLRPELSEEHPYYGWSPRPGLTERMKWRDYEFEFHHTSQGFRGTDLVTRERPAWAQHRILMVGDSVLYGLGSADEEIFAEILKDEMSTTEIINSGAPGYGLRQELAVVDILGETLRPDMIVVIYRWNDPEDDMRNTTPAFELGPDGRVVRTDVTVPKDFDPLAMREALPLPDEPEDAFYKNLNLYRAAKNGVRELRDRFLPPQRRHAIRAWLRIAKNTVLGREHDRIDRPDDRARAWAITTELLELLKARSDELGAQLVIVSVPAYSLVSDTRYGRYHEEINTNIEDSLRETCAALGIEYVDLLPEMRRLDPLTEEPLYFYRDNHLAPAGNAVVASLLKDILPAYLH